MADLARYIRIYDPSPDDDLVAKRGAAVKDVVTLLRKPSGAAALVALVGAATRSFATEAVADPLGSTMATAIGKHAPSFVREEREREVAVLAAVALMELLETSDTTNTIATKDVIAAALWSALSLQAAVSDPKHEQLRQDLLRLASERSLARAEHGRRRSVPAEIPAFAAEDLTQMGSAITGAISSITVLTTNAALDREEIDVLWWALGGRSPTTGEVYAGLPAAVHGVVRGIELGILMRRLPSQSMRSIALSGVPKTDPMALSQVIDAAADILAALSARIPAADTVRANPEVFPLLAGLLGVSIPNKVLKSGDEWCGRAVLEAGIAAICQTPTPRI